MSSWETGLTPDTLAAVQLLLLRAEALGLRATVRSGARSCALQNQIYAKGRTAPGAIETYAQGCQSWHVLGRAVDLTLVPGGSSYAQLAAYWKALGGKWGGDFPGAAAALKDVGHFEWHPGLSIADVCKDPGACAIDAQRNGAGTWPAEAPREAPSGGSGLGWALVGAAAAGVGWWLWDGRQR